MLLLMKQSQSMSNLDRLEKTIDTRLQGTVVDAIATTADIDRFTDVVAQAIAARVDEIPESIACKVVAYSASSNGKSLIGLLLQHLLRASTTPPKYIPVSAIAPAVESALADFAVETIELSEWGGDTIDLTDW